MLRSLGEIEASVSSRERPAGLKFLVQDYAVEADSWLEPPEERVPQTRALKQVSVQAGPAPPDSTPACTHEQHAREHRWIIVRWCRRLLLQVRSGTWMGLLALGTTLKESKW